MKYYIIAGEASGDLHGSNLIKALKGTDSQMLVWAWGGEGMETAGAVLRKHYRDLAFMGFVEVVKNLRTIRRNMAFCKQDILDFQPAVVVFIDYPGFNMRIAKWAKQQGFRTHYYISPQIWAWHTARVHSIKATIDRLFCILPFEQAFYRQFDFEVDFVGHPLLDVVKDFQANAHFRKQNGLDERPIIALLPGSRRQEVEKMLSLMLSILPQFPTYQFVIAGAKSLDDSFYQSFIQQRTDTTHPVFFVRNQTYDLLKNASAALVKSGTSTLEAALFDVPQVVCYKGSFGSYLLAKQFIKVKYISLVNLIADKPIVQELIQNDLTQTNLVHALQKTLADSQIIRKGYDILRGLLGEPGASERTARLIFNDLA
jgi:lipid-A-disaccharide synthase